MSRATRRSTQNTNDNSSSSSQQEELVVRRSRKVEKEKPELSSGWIISLEEVKERLNRANNKKYVNFEDVLPEGNFKIEMSRKLRSGQHIDLPFSVNKDQKEEYKAGFLLYLDAFLDNFSAFTEVSERNIYFVAVAAYFYKDLSSLRKADKFLNSLTDKFYWLYLSYNEDLFYPTLEIEMYRRRTTSSLVLYPLDGYPLQYKAINRKDVLYIRDYHIFGHKTGTYSETVQLTEYKDIDPLLPRGNKGRDNRNIYPGDVRKFFPNSRYLLNIFRGSFYDGESYLLNTNLNHPDETIQNYSTEVIRVVDEILRVGAIIAGGFPNSLVNPAYYPYTQTIDNLNYNSNYNNEDLFRGADDYYWKRLGFKRDETQPGSYINIPGLYEFARAYYSRNFPRGWVTTDEKVLEEIQKDKTTYKDYDFEKNLKELRQYVRIADDDIQLLFYSYAPDIDIFLVGDNISGQLNEIINAIFSLTPLGKMPIMHYTEFATTIDLGQRYPKFQIIKRAYSNVEEILGGFDLDSSRVALKYNPKLGKREIVATKSYIKAVEFGINLIVPSRQSETFNLRLDKYYNRGFEPYIPGDILEEFMKEKDALEKRIGNVGKLITVQFRYNPNQKYQEHERSPIAQLLYNLEKGFSIKEFGPIVRGSLKELVYYRGQNNYTWTKGNLSDYDVSALESISELELYKEDNTLLDKERAQLVSSTSSSSTSSSSTSSSSTSSSSTSSSSTNQRNDRGGMTPIPNRRTRFVVETIKEKEKEKEKEESWEEEQKRKKEELKKKEEIAVKIRQQLEKSSKKVNDSKRKYLYPSEKLEAFEEGLLKPTKSDIMWLATITSKELLSYSKSGEDWNMEDLENDRMSIAINLAKYTTSLFWRTIDPGTQFTGSFNPTKLDYLAGKDSGSRNKGKEEEYDFISKLNNLLIVHIEKNLIKYIIEYMGEDLENVLNNILRFRSVTRNDLAELGIGKRLLDEIEGKIPTKGREIGKGRRLIRTEKENRLTAEKDEREAEEADRKRRKDSEQKEVERKQAERKFNEEYERRARENRLTVTDFENAVSRAQSESHLRNSGVSIGRNNRRKEESDNEESASEEEPPSQVNNTRRNRRTEQAVPEPKEEVIVKTVSRRTRSGR